MSNLAIGLCQMLPVISPGLGVRSYQVSMVGKCCAGYECTLEESCCIQRLAATSTGPGAGQWKVQGTRVLLLPVDCLVCEPLKEPQMVCELHEAGFQLITI